jgi:hypothetical protein
MRRLVRFVGPARPEMEQATESQASSQSMPSPSEPSIERPLDVAPGATEQMSETGVLDAVAREG